MEGGRQAEIAKSILGSMNVPYIVAAPLLIQVGLKCSISRRPVHTFGHRNAPKMRRSWTQRLLVPGASHFAETDLSFTLTWGNLLKSEVFWTSTSHVELSSARL